MRVPSPAAIAITSLTVFVAGSARAGLPGRPAASVAAVLAQSAEVPQIAILDFTLTKGGANELKPSLRVPLGSEASIQAAPDVTLSVTRALLNGKLLMLRIGVSETMPQGTMESLATIDVLLDKPVKLQLGSDPARSWLIEFTPRLTPAPVKPAG